MSKPAKPVKGQDKGKSKDKGKKGKGAAEPAPGVVVMSVASHPRARGQIRQAKGWGGLAAFALTLYLSFSHGVSPDVAGMRAIAAGFAGYVVAWGCGVMVWRHLMVAELRARVEKVRRELEGPAAPAGAPAAEHSSGS